MYMNAKLIVMLTLNDVTADNAVEVFNECKDLPVMDWGFKNVGLNEEKRAYLAQIMKEAGKTVYIEDVLNSEEDTLEMAIFAHKNKVDNIFGRYFSSVKEYAKNNGLGYYTCSTKSSGIPVMLRGPITEIVDQLKGYVDKGVDGICIGAYRHESDPEGLIKLLTSNINKPIIIAGSINSEDRMQFVNDQGCAGFTMGSALFDKKFVKDGSFRDNLIEVMNIMNKIG